MGVFKMDAPAHPQNETAPAFHAFSDSSGFRKTQSHVLKADSGR